MKKVTFILIVLIILTGCNKQGSSEKTSIKIVAPDIILQVSQKFGEPRPVNSGVESNKDIHIFSMEGNFRHPWDANAEKADKISFIVNNEGKITQFEGFIKERQVWKINLQPINWKRFINLSSEEYKSIMGESGES